SCVPSKFVLELIADAADRGVKAVQMFTGRFSETGKAEDIDLEKRMIEAARDAGVRIIGPNCMGILYPDEGITFRADMSSRSGPIGFISQSGNLLFELTHFSESRGLLFSKAVSYGNGIDLNEADFLEYLAADDATKVIGAYIEGVRDGRRFLDALRTAGREKPVVVFKGGRTGAGARSAVSHTAALAGSSEVWRGALRQAGAIEVHSQDELIDLFVAFTLFSQAPAGRRVGAVGGGGGRAVQAADACTEEGLEVPPLSDDIRSQIRERAPDLWDWIGNPVDQSILAGAGAGVSGAAVLEMMLDSPQFDLLIANVGEDWVLGRPDSARRLNHIVERFAGIGRRSQKPIAYVLGPADSPDEERWRAVEQARTLLVDAGLAVFPTVERAAWALGRYVQWYEARA
ncbi:MAG: CoA-binding protein, partial [Chloroflexi bacterium]|nr:CoA-binding protein [Chloroflexota bacterium]